MNVPRKPRPKQTGTFIGVRVQPEHLKPLDAWIAAQPDPKPSRPEAIRYALVDWLNGRGHVFQSIGCEEKDQL